MKILQYSELEQLGDQIVYDLELPSACDIRGAVSLEAVTSRVRYKASTLVKGKVYPMAVATEKEWLQATKDKQEMKIQEATDMLKLLNTWG